MRTVSVEAEARALVTILEGGKCSSYLLGNLRSGKMKRGEVVEEGHFGHSPCRQIFKRILRLLQAGKDLPSIDIMAEDQNLSPEAQDILKGDFESVRLRKDARDLFKILEDHRRTRVLVSALRDAADTLKDDACDISDVEADLSSCLSSLSNKEEIKIVRTGKDGTAKQTVLNILSDRPRRRIKTGFKVFDDRTGGFQRPSLVVLSAPSTGGKSVMATQMAVNMYREFCYNVCLISLEMDSDSIYRRILSNIAEVSHTKMDLNQLNPSQRKKVQLRWEEFQAIGDNNNCRFDIWCPHGEYTATNFGALLKPYGFDAIIVDYISLMATSGGDSEAQRLGETARTFKIVSSMLDATIVLLAQFNEEKNRVKYSTAIKEHADNLWMWHWGEQEKELGETLVIQDKARNTRAFNFKLGANFNLMRWESIEGDIQQERHVSELSLGEDAFIVEDNDDE